MKEKILKLRKDGLSIREIASKLKISKGKVQYTIETCTENVLKPKTVPKETVPIVPKIQKQPLPDHPDKDIHKTHDLIKRGSKWVWVEKGTKQTVPLVQIDPKTVPYLDPKDVPVFTEGEEVPDKCLEWKRKFTTNKFYPKGTIKHYIRRGIIGIEKGFEHLSRAELFNLRFKKD